MRNYRNGVEDAYMPDLRTDNRSYTLLRIGPFVTLMGYGPVMDGGYSMEATPKDMLRDYADEAERNP